MTFELLPAAIGRLHKRVYREVNKATQKVAAVILETAADGTPVDTTQALSNWQVGKGSGPNSFIGPRVPGSAGSTKLASLRITVDQGKYAMKNRVVGSTIHIVNNAPYIDGLNDGTISRQPAGFVQKAMLAGDSQLAATRLDLRERRRYGI